MAAADLVRLCGWLLSSAGLAPVPARAVVPFGCCTWYGFGAGLASVFRMVGGCRPQLVPLPWSSCFGRICAPAVIGSGFCRWYGFGSCGGSGRFTSAGAVWRSGCGWYDVPPVPLSCLVWLAGWLSARRPDLVPLWLCRSWCVVLSLYGFGLIFSAWAVRRSGLSPVAALRLAVLGSVRF